MNRVQEVQQGINARNIAQRNALLLDQERQKMQREAGMRNVLNPLFKPSVPTMISSTPAGPGASEMQPAVTPTTPDVIQALGESGYAPEALKMMQGYEAQQKGGNIGTYNPRDYTTESWARYVQTGDPSVLKRYTEKTINIGGVPNVLVPGRGFVPVSTLEKEAKGLATKKAAETTAAAQATAAQGLPAAEYAAERTKTQIDDLLKMPGLEDSFGVKSYLPVIRGSDRANFQAKLDQLKSTIFMSNRAKLKGGGSITDFEGQQAANAETAMSQSQTAAQFKKSMEDYKYWVDEGMRKLREAADKKTSPQSAEQTYQSSGGITFTVK